MCANSWDDYDLSVTSVWQDNFFTLIEEGIFWETVLFLDFFVGDSSNEDGSTIPDYIRFKMGFFWGLIGWYKYYGIT